MIGMSVPSLHREYTDFVINTSAKIIQLNDSCNVKPVYGEGRGRTGNERITKRMPLCGEKPHDL